MGVIEMVRMLGNGEFDEVDNGKIQFWDDFVSPMVSREKYGKLYNQAKALLICHKMKLSGEGSGELSGSYGKINTSFGISSISDGGTSISFNTGAANVQQSNAEYAMTSYGLQFLEIKRNCIVAITINKGL